MKKLSIGRNNSCDIIIPDTSDLVSRKQAVLAFSFFGKMILYDTSNNGTYVNGQKLENGKGLRVTRKDKINFARIADLDWNEVKDPYSSIKKVLVVSALATIVVVALLVWWFSRPEKEDHQNPVNIENPINKGETVTTIQPQVVEQPKQRTVVKKKKNSNKSKSATPNELLEKEVNENSPIVY